MPETIVPFPLLRRRRIVAKITKHAISAARVSEQAAHDWILDSVRIQRGELIRKGVSAATAEREAEALWEALWGSLGMRVKSEQTA
jgi:hypothetical protein